MRQDTVSLAEISQGKNPIGETRLAEIPIGKISRGSMARHVIGRCAFIKSPLLNMVLMMIVGMGKIGLMGCTPALHDDELPMRFDDYCAYRAAEGVHVPLCAQDEAGRMLALYAFSYGCHYADPASLTDCLYLQTEVDRLILRDIDNMIDRDMMQILP